MFSMMDWLMSPLSGAAHPGLAPWAAWHARCMVLGWGLLLPLGALIARYFKLTRQPGQPQPLDPKGWWHAHRWLQWLGVAAMSAGAALAWGQAAGASAAARAHAWAGWALVLVAWLQVAGGLLRGSKGGPTEPHLRADHYDMTPRRQAFERLHKGLGWLALLASVGVISLGLVLVDAPRWMAVTLAAWWGLLAAAAWRWQAQGRCLDTYQAIWGADTAHPGNRRRPIGWGVRRLLPPDTQQARHG